MVHVAECLGVVAQYYNIALVLIVLALYITMLILPHKKTFIQPWKFVFISLCIYVVEQVTSILNTTGVMKVHPVIFPIFEFFIITIFIYALLTMKEHIKGGKNK